MDKQALELLRSLEINMLHLAESKSLIEPAAFTGFAATLQIVITALESDTGTYNLFSLN